MISRIVAMFGSFAFGWLFFVSSLWMNLPPDKPFLVATATILFIKLIFMAAALLYSFGGFAMLVETLDTKGQSDEVQEG